MFFNIMILSLMIIMLDTNFKYMCLKVKFLFFFINLHEDEIF